MQTMKKKYENPELEVLEYRTFNIVTDPSYITDDNNEDAGNLFG